MVRKSKGPGPIQRKFYLTQAAIERLEAATVGTPMNMSAIVDQLILTHLPATDAEKARYADELDKMYAERAAKERAAKERAAKEREERFKAEQEAARRNRVDRGLKEIEKARADKPPGVPSGFKLDI